MMTDSEKLALLDRHIDNVGENCRIVAAELIKAGEFILAKKLVAVSRIHDNSKYNGIEWDFLDPTHTNKAGLKQAILQHQATNPHHPQYWGTIQDMPLLYLVEMTCDWCARGHEQGTNTREWIDKEATKRFKFTKDDETYKKIMKYVDMICTKPFESLEQIHTEISTTPTQNEQSSSVAETRAG